MDTADPVARENEILESTDELTERIEEAM